MSKNARNDKETNNIKLTNSLQVLATANDKENTIDDISDASFHQVSDEKVTVNPIAEQSVCHIMRWLSRSYHNILSNKHSKDR